MGYSLKFTFFSFEKIAGFSIIYVYVWYNVKEFYYEKTKERRKSSRLEAVPIVKKAFVIKPTINNKFPVEKKSYIR